jgi:hypothetical protein
MIEASESNLYMEVINSVKHVFKSGVQFQFEKFTNDPNNGAITLFYHTTHQGGKGISGRFLSEIECVLPGITTRISTEEGKIVFIGNGTSNAPLEGREKYGHKNITINDAFSYNELLQYLIIMRDAFSNTRLEYPLSFELDDISKLCFNIHTGNITAVRYKFGTDNIP